MKISVIIPAYNCGKYLKKQIESLLSQMEDAQIIVVDNNSSDDTKEIANSYPQVLVTEEKKVGASAARNKGVSLAEGEFVVFVDGDDQTDNNYLSSLVDNFQNENCVLSVCGYNVNVTSNNKTEKIKESPKEKEKLLWQEMLERLFHTKYYEGYIWNKMFRRDIIEKHQLCFDEDIFFNEDRLFIVNYLLAAKGNVYFSEQHTYEYMIREDSAMNSFRNGSGVSEKEITEFLAFEKMNEAVKKENLPRVQYLLEEDMIQSELRCFKRMISKEDVFKYRKSRMRYYAKKSREISYEVQGQFEDVLLHVFQRYGWSGCTYTKNPDLFKDIGIL